MFECVFCLKKDINFFNITNRNYYFCNNCGGIFVGKESFVCENTQKDRYLFHKNTLKNAGYKKFLQNFIDPVLEKVIHKVDINQYFSIFDFGSGPEPCLIQLLYEYIDNGQLPKNTQLFYYDKFFTSKKIFVPSNLCVCLEVVEHFENIDDSFNELSQCVISGGFLAIGSAFVPEKSFSIEEFSKWWYKNDITHVSFYTIKAIIEVSKRAGFSFYAQLNDKCILLQKI